MSSLSATYRPLLEAVAFAARAHRHQLRKDGQTPYVSHVFRVTLITQHVFGITDRQVLTTAVLHDTIEDTTTDYDDVLERFGREVADGVALLSKDKRQEEGPREAEYKKRLAAAPWQVKVCKLADIFDNSMDAPHTRPEQRRKTCRRSREYLAVLNTPDLPEAARRAWDLVNQLLSETEAEVA
jgi:guanosine-3',5'-bis(diphosphate) 3'-pyrophosphohydrolase